MKSCVLIVILTLASPTFANTADCTDNLEGKIKTVCVQVLHTKSPGDMLNQGLLRNREVMKTACSQGYVPFRRDIGISASTGFEKLQITETYSCEPW